MLDVIVIGSGPGGISSAIYLKRGGLDPLVLTTHNSNLFKAHKIDNYYGVVGMTGKELYDFGIKQALDLNVNIREEEVVSISKDNNIFKVKTDKNEYICKSIVIATGISVNKCHIKGVSDYAGRGVSYCAVCDGYFFKNRKLGLIGSGDFAYSEYEVLKNISSDLIIFTNLNKENVFASKNIATIDNEIVEIVGDDVVTGVTLDNGEIINIEGLFIAVGQAGSIEFARKLGLAIDKNNLMVDSVYKTNIDGIYAVGDAIGGFLQVSTAVGEGAVVSREIIKFLKSNTK